MKIGIIEVSYIAIILTTCHEYWRNQIYCVCMHNKCNAISTIVGVGEEDFSDYVYMLLLQTLGESDTDSRPRKSGHPELERFFAFSYLQQRQKDHWKMVYSCHNNYFKVYNLIEEKK